MPTVAAIEAGKTIGLANKEVLISGGALVMALAKKRQVAILPIDSEHSALFQCLNGEPKESVRRLILTASGGPFRNFTAEQLRHVTVEQALRHPTWDMGAKVTIDCSTLMNKGLEVIEAHWLFDTPMENISVIIHPQSIIHSMVEFVDRGIMAQMGVSSMLLPIQYALTYPERLPGCLEPFDFVKHNTLQFITPDYDKFRCLRLAFDAAKIGGSLPCYMNAANEVLVNSFIEKRIGWHEISTKLDALMAKHQTMKVSTFEEILFIDAKARQEASNSLD
jgi:1-deoxy-D-xylulose-5-phosphate reductoisomerase